MLLERVFIVININFSHDITSISEQQLWLMNDSLFHINDF